eukprot:gb/GEZJ01002606.1/.p2 GENE.gb/GEZJ01002606.1/~~gb/GEZJ01002606.1/.p2  ORF type:complete len:228 (+),score=26.32 gb/GEZJ01002606.1/:1554-2237(+)
MPLDVSTEYERKMFRKMAGEMIWLGSGALPQAAYVGSAMQQKLPRLTVRDIMEGNKILTEISRLQPVITFRRQSSLVTDVEIVTFSGAAFNVAATQMYGQTGLVTGLRYRTEDGDATTYYLIDLSGSKQRRASYSSYGAEILSCTDVDDRGFHIKSAMKYITPEDNFRHILHVESKGPFDTTTTLHEGKDYRLRQTVQRIRDSFESRELDTLKWVQGKAYIADALTK